MKEAIITIVILFVMINIFTFAVSFNAANKMQEEMMQTEDCQIYYLADIPFKVVIEGFEYPLNEVGVMDQEDRMFLNPWHQQIIASGKCEDITFK
jgi:hypothetical protein